jgi:hypothetical protein
MALRHALLLALIFADEMSAGPRRRIQCHYKGDYPLKGGHLVTSVNRIRRPLKHTIVTLSRNRQVGDH